ncbi:MAG: transposase [Xenococcus sp. MO_188.B8]|nr:transposase [Xenococcus sp. MO_188.B8]
MQQLIPLELFSYFLVFQCHFSKPNFVYFQGYLWGLLLTRGRKTMNNIAHCCFWVERSLSSWERFLSENLWDVNAVVKTLVTLLLQKLENQLQVHGGYLVGLDTLLLAKNGQKMSGVQLWKDHSGNANRGERLQGHHWGLLGLIGWEQKSQRYWCWPVKMRLISGKLNPFQFIVDPEGKARRANFWDGVIPLVLDLKQQLNSVVLRVVVDAYFCKVPFLAPLVAAGISVVTRMRKDAVAWDQRIESGTRKKVKMEGEWKLAQLLQKFTPRTLSVKIYGQQVQVEAVEREVFIRGFGPQVKVVVAKGKKEPIIFLSTDLTLTAAQIIEIYAARFSIELAIRDLKQHFGLAHYQCYLGIAIDERPCRGSLGKGTREFDRFVHLACIAYCLFGLFQRQQLKFDWMPKVSALHSELSFSRLRRGLQHFAISRVLSPKSASEADFPPQSPELDQILRLVA